jgi:hypothetical protein
MYRIAKGLVPKLDKEYLKDAYKDLKVKSPLLAGKNRLINELG